MESGKEKLVAQHVLPRKSVNNSFLSSHQLYGLNYSKTSEAKVIVRRRQRVNTTVSSQSNAGQQPSPRAMVMRG